MKFTAKILLVSLALGFSSCEKFLDRPPLTSETDESAWSSEEKLRLYANKYYTDFFPGYGLLFNTAGAPLVGFTNSDDYVILGNQPNFTLSVPNSSIWDYSTIRSINIMLNRIDDRMVNILSEEAADHWSGVGKFFRAMEYADLVRSYGDVPYYDREVKDTEEAELYKARDPRNQVMDHVYEDWKFALTNIRLNDGEQNLNRYIAAGFISRLALYEGSWQKYYYKNNDRAQKFFELALEAAQMVMNSGRYDIVSEYRSLFTSLDLKGNKDIILYRAYNAAVGTTHAIASYANLQESTLNGPTTDLIKDYLLNDGQTWSASANAEVKNFDLLNLIKTRDPRFEATFYHSPSAFNKGSYLYINKFFPRSIEKAVKEDGQPMPAEYTGSKNETDAPVLRYAEVLLNYLEAKAELAILGAAPVTQEDVDKTVNKLRNRPLAAEAVAKGVTKTAAMTLAALPVDADRDTDVSPLLWEIRRERRMEFAFETNRLNDLRRWSKIQYMDHTLNPDIMSGAWVDFPAQLNSELVAGNVNKLAVVDVQGKETVYNGSNSGLMKGFYKNQGNRPRQPFYNIANLNPYLTPVGISQMDAYEIRGYVLQQTQGWPQQ